MSVPIGAFHFGGTISLWPSVPPGTPEDFPPERIADLSESPFHPDRELTRISRPGLTVIRPELPNGAAVIVAPGGGYSRIAMDKEGREIAAWLGQIGITTFLMTYRLPGEGHANGADVPLQDAQRAVRIVRANARDWGLDPARIGLMGASAAGHMVASAVTGFDRAVYQAVDAADEMSARPDFAVLLYPVITMASDFAHAGSRLQLIGEAPDDETVERYSPDRNVSVDVPEVFLVLSDEDQAVVPENAIRFYQGLRRAGVRAEMHIFRDGQHGFGIERVAHLPAGRWPELCAAWMKRIGVL